MTLEQLQALVNLPPDKAVEALKVKEIDLPSWKDTLVYQYDAMLHPIMIDFQRYPKKPNEAGADTFRRIPLALQALAVDKQSQAVYYNDVQRKYTYPDGDQYRKAADILEENIKEQNHIDSSNLNRAKELFKACEVVTLYKLDPTEPCMIKDYVSTSSLKHYVYSPALGYDLYPYFDSNKKLVGIGIAYTVKEYSNGAMVDVQYLLVYVPGGVITYKNSKEWEVADVQTFGQNIVLATYAHIPEPIWGGDEGSLLVEVLEELRSKNQMYIDKNQVPMYAMYRGENTIAKKGDIQEEDDDARRIIELGKNGFVNPVAWEGAAKAVTDQFNSTMEQYYQQVQMFDNRPSSMQTKAMSAENKEILMFDAKARAKDISGVLLEMHQTEFAIFKFLTGVQFPSLATALQSVNARTIIIPYSLYSREDTSQYVYTSRMAGGMSKRTAVALLAEVDNVDDELDQMALEEQATNNF